MDNQAEPIEITNLLHRCAAYCSLTGMSDSVLARHLLKDSRGLQRLRDGKDIGVRTLKRVEGDLAAMTETATAAAAKKAG